MIIMVQLVWSISAPNILIIVSYSYSLQNVSGHSQIPVSNWHGQFLTHNGISFMSTPPKVFTQFKCHIYICSCHLMIAWFNFSGWTSPTIIAIFKCPLNTPVSSISLKWKFFITQVMLHGPNRIRIILDKFVKSYHVYMSQSVQSVNILIFFMEWCIYHVYVKSVKSVKSTDWWKYLLMRITYSKVFVMLPRNWVS